jgi:5-methylcytosine-specific restriction endonuclease McrA
MAVVYYISPKWKGWIIQAHGGRCYYCGQPACQIDHIDPKKHGGSDDLGNLLPACAPCNGRKGARPLPFFKRMKAKRAARAKRKTILALEAGKTPARPRRVIFGVATACAAMLLVYLFV